MWSSIKEFALTVPQNFNGKAMAPVSYTTNVDGVDLLKFPLISTFMQGCLLLI